MSTTGIEVEGVESPAAGLSKLLSEKSCLVKMCPKLICMSAKSMWVKKKPQIVCGAPNVRAGIKVMVALPGARIADNYKIKKGKSVA